MRSNKGSKSRLLFVTPTGDLKAGGEISNLELIKAAVEKGYGVHVVVPLDGQLGLSLKKLGIPHSVITYSWWIDGLPRENSLEDIAAIGKIRDLISKENIDCVITNTLNVPWASFASALADKPHVWIAREFPVNEFSYLEDHYDYIQGMSNLVIANSKNVAKDMKDRFRVPAKHFYSFVDSSGLKLKVSSNRGLRLVSVGHIQPRKNQIELVEAVAKLKTEHGLRPDVLFIGQNFDDTYFKKIGRLVKRHGLENQVKFEDYNPKPFSLITPSDIFVQTSKSESIGRTTTEAMKLGLICVGADIPGITEAFGLGGGTLYKSGNPADLAKKLRVILTDLEKYKELGAESQKRALKNMSSEACHDPFFRELEKVIGKPNPQKMLRHLAPFMSGASESLAHNERERQKIKKDLASSAVHIRNLEAQLKDIKASRAYKGSVRIRKVLKRG